MAQDPRRCSAGTYGPYINQYPWLSGDEEGDSRDGYTTNGQRAYGTSFDPGAGHYVGTGLQTTDGRAGPYPCDTSSNLQSPYHPAVGSAQDLFAYYPPQQPYGGPAESEPRDLGGHCEGRIDRSGLPGPAYGEPQPETSELFRGTPQMLQEQGRDSPRSIDAEQGSDEYACRLLFAPMPSGVLTIALGNLLPGIRVIRHGLPGVMGTPWT